MNLYTMIAPLTSIFFSGKCFLSYKIAFFDIFSHMKTYKNGRARASIENPMPPVGLRIRILTNDGCFAKLAAAGRRNLIVPGT